MQHSIIAKNYKLLQYTAQLNQEYNTIFNISIYLMSSLLFIP